MPQRGVGVGEVDERRDGARLGDRVGVRVEDVLAGGRCDAEVHVRGESVRGAGSRDADALRHGAGRARDVRDDEHLVHLRSQGGERRAQLGLVPVRDDDGGDLHEPSISRYTASVRSARSHAS